MSKIKKKYVKLNSIKTRLITILLLICIIPVLVLGFLSYSKSVNILTNKLKITTEQTLSQVNGGINNYFKGIQNTANMMTNNIDFKELLIHPEYAPFAKNILKDVKESNSDLLNVYFGTSTKKILIYPEQKLPDGYDPTSRPWYQNAVNNKGSVAFSNPYKDAGSGKFIISISKAVESNGQVVGVISIDIDLTTLSKELSDIKIGREGYVYISDNTGIIIAHPDTTKLGTDAITKISIWDKIKSNNSGFEQYVYDGIPKLACYETNKASGWKLVAALNESELLADTNIIRNLTLVFILVIGVLAVFISLLVSNSITKHIFNLKDLFEKASNGDLSVRVNIKSKDEFADLGNNFNHMIDNISSLIDNVKKSADTIGKTSDAMNAMSNWAGKQESLAQENKGLLQAITNNIPAVNGVKPTTMDVWNNINKYKKGEYQPRTSAEKDAMDKYIANSNDLTNQKAIYEQKEKEVYQEMGLDFNKTLSKQLSGVGSITIGTGANKTTFTSKEIYEYLKKEKSKIVGKADAQQLYVDPATLTEREKQIYNLVQGRYQGVSYGGAKSTGNTAIDAVINKIAPIAGQNSQIDSEVKRRIGLKMAPITGGFSREQAGVTFKDGTDKSNFVISLSNIVQSDLKQKTGGENYDPSNTLKTLTKAKLDDVDFQLARQGDTYVVQVTDKDTKETHIVPVTAEFVARTKQLGTKWLSQNVPVADRVLRNAGSTNLTGKFENSYYSTGLFGGTVQGRRTVTLPVAADLTYEGGQTFPIFRMLDKNGEQLFYQYYDATDPKTFKDVFLPSLNDAKIIGLFKNKYPNIEQLISK